MSVDHTFIGTWEIVSCTFEKKSEISGLEGIKFRLDDTSDITWYNDLVSPIPQSKDCGICCDSASVLFSCETYDVNESNPRLIFGAFAGHSIEFRTNTLTPTDTLILDCENWYALECKRLKDSQAVGQEKEFNFIEALNASYFSDVVIKSSNGDEFHAHSVILRLNGFDCSMCVLDNAPTSVAHTVCRAQQEIGQQKDKYRESISGPNTPNNIKISVACPRAVAATQSDLEDNQKSLPRLNLSPIYLQPPAEYSNFGSILGFSGNLSAHRSQQLSSSFNCLPTNAKQNDKNCINFHNVDISGVGNKQHLPPTSHSDSHLETQAVHCKNIFNFCQDMVLQSTEPNTVCNVRRPPLSPYRARSPSPFPSSMDTPPSSPLTPVGVLFNLPTFLLRPILHWLYTESLMSEMNEEVCEKLINFAETQPSLTKMVEPTRKYLTLIRLKKFVVDIIMDLHDLLNRIIQSINPVTISHEPSQLCACFKNCLRECAIGCAKVLQFCNIFIKDATDISRYQKNEIIKYVRTRIPIFMSQIHQLLRNILNVLISLTIEEKADLVNYLVPEIETTLLVLTNVIEEIKNSLEKMCKDLKCSHLDLAHKTDIDNAVTMQLQSNTILTTPINLNVDETSAQHFIAPSLLPSRRLPVALTLYDHPHENQRFMTVENNLKFVLYMYEVRKMRDIYGRISTALDIIRNKKVTFCEMDSLSKRSTIHQNLEQLIEDIPTYVLIVENWSDRLEEKLAWKEFKFCFKLATSQINGVIVKLFDHKLALRDPINEVCKIVRKSEFTQSLIDLGLIESSNILKIELGDHENNITRNKTEWRNNYDSKNINLIRHLCESPLTINSNLSKNALRLLHSAQLADMEFEVHTGVGKSCSTIVNIPNITVLHDNLSDMENLHTKHSVQNNSAFDVHTFKAHRVIVSARCEWFKKALLSGMQESITKKVIITDTTPVIFRRLLLYLYGAPIDKTVGAEQICELMLLADRYSIDDLKELCENTLNSLVDEESVLCLLGIADRYMASALKSNCMTFLSQHAYVTKVDIFKELPQALQLEVMDLINWFGRVSEPWNDGFKSRSSSRHSLKSPSKPRSRSRKSSPSYI